MRMFILTRDGIPLYAGRQIEFVAKQLALKLLDAGYSPEVIDNKKIIVEQHEPFVAVIHHPYLREAWRVYGVFAD
jgi:hypothetical protein